MADTHPMLQQLADISEPALEHAFALPPLAWLAVIILCLGLVYLFWTQYRRWRFFAAKREALALLARLDGKTDSASDVNQLLKRVLRHYQKTHPALSLPVAQWQQWLATGCTSTLPDLNALLYSTNADPAANQQFYQFAKLWLRAYKGNAPTDNINGDQHA